MFNPFCLNWHFQREEISRVVNTVIEVEKETSKPKIISVEGYPGTGRTFCILAAVQKLIENHKSIAINISNNSSNSIPSVEELDSFINELILAAKKFKTEEPKRVVFWSEFPIEMEFLSKFHRLTTNCKLPATIIMENILSSENGIKDLDTSEKIIINVDADMPTNQKEKLAKYLLETVKKHKLPEITEEEAYMIIRKEKRFLPIMYRILDHARRSIDKIVLDEYNGISDKTLKECILMVALATSQVNEIPIAVLRKALGKNIGKIITYPEIFEIIDNSYTFIKKREDSRTNTHVSIYHPVVANYIVNLSDIKKMDGFLKNIAETVDLVSQVEADFAGSIFIDKGVNWMPKPYSSRNFSDDGLETALLEIKKRQPARPILHHLARFYAFNQKKIHSPDIIPLLEEALADTMTRFALEERKENVLTTLGIVKWKQNKDKLINLPRNNPEIQEIFDILKEARTSYSSNIHPFDVHARIIRELMENKDEYTKMSLTNEATEIINQGLDVCVDDPDGITRLSNLLIEILSDVDIKKAEVTAKELFELKNDGTGYYTLARIEYHQNANPEKASVHLDRALAADNCPPGAIELKIKKILRDKFPNYNYLHDLVKRLNTDGRFKETWKSAYHMAIIYLVNGNYKNAVTFFKFARYNCPWTIQKFVQVFWMEGGRRKIHTGKIGSVLTEKEGRIYSHGITGWKSDIFFDPRSQSKISELKSGLNVEFELGFSPRGPIAFDVRLKSRTPN